MDIIGQVQKKIYMGMSLVALFVIITTKWRQIPNLIITMYLYIGIPCGYNYRIIVVPLLTWEKVLKKQVTKQCAVFVNSYHPCIFASGRIDGKMLIVIISERWNLGR